MDWTYFLACIISVSSFATGQTLKYVLKGTGENFKPDISGHPSSILWKHDGNKVVEFNGTMQQVFGSYENRITLNWITAELEIAGLRFEDSGNYEAEVFINNYLHTEEYQLVVIDRVSKPTISCKINRGSPDESEDQATLLCSAVKPEPLMNFEWRSQESSTPGDKITFSLKDQQGDEQYTCVVSNPLSSETATFTVKDCYHEDSSSLALIIALSILALIGVLGTGMGILFCKFKQKACFADDEDKRTSESENRTSQMEHLLPEGHVKKKVAMYEQIAKNNEANRGPASPSPKLDLRFKPFDQTKNDEGGQNDVLNQSLQEKAPSEETPAPDESPHPDIPAHSADEHNKEPEVIEETAGTTTGPDLSSGQWPSSVPEQESSDTTALKEVSDSSKDADNKEETKKQNQVKQVQEKAPGEEASAPATDETSHLTEASPDRSEQAENEDNKESEVSEEKEETTTGPDLSSRQRISSVPEQEGLDKTPLKKDSDPQKDEENTEETYQLNQEKQGQEKAPSEETPATTTDKTSHPSKASSDIPEHTENEHNVETEITEKTEEITTGPDSS